MMIKKFRYVYKDLKNIQNKIKELELLREEEIHKIKNVTKRELKKC